MIRDYHAVADSLAADITSGKLPPGTRLPPQRAFAYERGIAASVAALCKPGDRIGVEPLTYPAIIRLAGQLGIQLVPIPIDK